MSSSGDTDDDTDEAVEAVADEVKRVEEAVGGEEEVGLVDVRKAEKRVRRLARALLMP